MFVTSVVAMVMLVANFVRATSITEMLATVFVSVLVVVVYVVLHFKEQRTDVPSVATPSQVRTAVVLDTNLPLVDVPIGIGVAFKEIVISLQDEMAVGVNEIVKLVRGSPTTPEGSRSGSKHTSETVSLASSVIVVIVVPVEEKVLQVSEVVQVVATLVVVVAAMPVPRPRTVVQITIEEVAKPC